jgi:hypothetical protein
VVEAIAAEDWLFRCESYTDRGFLIHRDLGGFLGGLISCAVGYPLGEILSVCATVSEVIATAPTCGCRLSQSTPATRLPEKQPGQEEEKLTTPPPSIRMPGGCSALLEYPDVQFPHRFGVSGLRATESGHKKGWFLFGATQ